MQDHLAQHHPRERLPGPVPPLLLALGCALWPGLAGQRPRRAQAGEHCPVQRAALSKAGAASTCANRCRAGPKLRVCCETACGSNPPPQGGRSPGTAAATRAQPDAGCRPCYYCLCERGHPPTRLTRCLSLQASPSRQRHPPLPCRGASQPCQARRASAAAPPARPGPPAAPAYPSTLPPSTIATGEWCQPLTLEPVGKRVLKNVTDQAATQLAPVRDLHVQAWSSCRLMSELHEGMRHPVPGGLLCVRSMLADVVQSHDCATPAGCVSASPARQDATLGLAPSAQAMWSQALQRPRGRPSAWYPACRQVQPRPSLHRGARSSAAALDAQPPGRLAAQCAMRQAGVHRRAGGRDM